jgi:hypothetical protein
MLLVVLGPAGRQSVGGEAQNAAADREDDREGGLERTRQRAPASASSTSVAWVTPDAPRAANGIVLRK